MSDFKTQASHEFTRWSENYDTCILQTLLFRPSHKAIIARVKSQRADERLTILDVGCGTGVFAARIRDAMPEARVVGIDLVSGMLQKGAERWKAHAEHVSPIQGDSERLPFASQSFDVLTCANSFHHYPHQGRAIEEMHRVLKPGGKLMLIDGYRDRPWGWFIYDVCVTTVEGAVHHASARRFRELTTAAGFSEIQQKVYRGPAPFLLTEATAGQRSVPAPHFGHQSSAGRTGRELRAERIVPRSL